jgi:hypothetical protein
MVILKEYQGRFVLLMVIHAGEEKGGEDSWYLSMLFGCDMPALLR